MNDKVKRKIQRKILGMGVYRLVSGDKPRLTPSEFRFIIGCYGIRRKEWWQVLKEMESLNVVKMSKCYRYINILMNGPAIQKFMASKEK